MMKLLLLTLSGVSLVFGGTVKVTPCSSTTGEVKIDMCSSSEDMCQFKRGSNLAVNINFEAPADSNSLTAELTVHLGSIDVPHPSFDRDVCNDYGVSCPVKKGNKYTYSFQMKVFPEYPKIKTTLKFSAKDQSGNLAFCFNMPVAITD